MLLSPYSICSLLDNQA